MILKTPNQIQSRRFNIKKESYKKDRGKKIGRKFQNIKTKILWST